MSVFGAKVVAERDGDEITDWDEEPEGDNDDVKAAFDDAYARKPWHGSEKISDKVRFLRKYIEHKEQTGKELETLIIKSLRDKHILQKGAATGSVGDAALLLRNGNCGPVCALKTPPVEEPAAGVQDDDETASDTGTFSGETSETAHKLLSVVREKAEGGPLKLMPTDEDLASALKASKDIVPDDDDDDDGPKRIGKGKRKRKPVAVDRPKLLQVLNSLTDKYNKYFYIVQHNKGILAWIMYLEKIGWDDLSSLKGDSDTASDSAGAGAPLTEQEKAAAERAGGSQGGNYGGGGYAERDLEDLIDQIRDVRGRLNQRVALVRQQRKTIDTCISSARKRITSSKGSGGGGSSQQESEGDTSRADAGAGADADTNSQTGSLTRESDEAVPRRLGGKARGELVPAAKRKAESLTAAQRAEQREALEKAERKAAARVDGSTFIKRLEAISQKYEKKEEKKKEKEKKREEKRRKKDGDDGIDVDE